MNHVVSVNLFALTRGRSVQPTRLAFIIRRLNPSTVPSSWEPDRVSRWQRTRDHCPMCGLYLYETREARSAFSATGCSGCRFGVIDGAEINLPLRSNRGLPYFSSGLRRAAHTPYGFIFVVRYKQDDNFERFQMLSHLELPIDKYRRQRRAIGSLLGRL